MFASSGGEALETFEARLQVPPRVRHESVEWHELSEVHLSKENDSSVIRLLGRVTEEREVQPQKAYSPIVASPSGKVTEVSEEQS